MFFPLFVAKQKSEQLISGNGRLTFAHHCGYAPFWERTVAPKTRINLPEPSGKNEQSEFARFDNFASKLLSVPHSKIKEQLDAEKRKQTSKASASGRASRDNR
jgi:hypothetical protein